MKKICISQAWRFRLEGKPWETIDLPHDYSITQPRTADAIGGPANGFFQGGVGVYEKELQLGDKHYILDIDGAYMCVAVRLNGYQLTMHPHGYTPWLVDLKKRSKPNDTNKLMIITNGVQPSTRWYSGAGIYRDVFLWEGGDIRIEPRDVFVTTPTLDTVHVSCAIHADRAANVILRTTILDGEGKLVQTQERPLTLAIGAKEEQIDFTLPDARLWSPEAPFLYTLHTEIIEQGETIEEDTTPFGIRTVSADAKNGLLLNGKPIKLRGGCIHHDHGVLGVADYPAACQRKLTLLKEAGFNALRLSHNPPSTTLLELCDRMGIILMDEIFDCWEFTKGGSLNYHIWFDDWWARDIAAAVRRDRNHPSVISYSTGNEIPESVGNCGGDEWSKILADEVRKHDNTRLLTVCTWEMGGPETWGERTEKYYEPLDICGYNYIFTRYERDHEAFPERVIWGSETHVLEFWDSWHLVMKHPYVIGDFTWTAYDNLGEVGTGRGIWARDGEIHRISMADYPWRTCYQGDLDLCGHRRPQSYYREAVWIGGAEPRIFTTHPEHYGEGYTGTGWHWYDVLDTWTFEDAYLGKPVKCEVYTDADEIEWFLNGVSLGRSKPERAIATFDIPYEKGEIMAVAYKNGTECGRSTLHTVGAPAQVQVKSETASLKADNRDLCYFDITIADENGDRVPNARNELNCLVEGGELMGIFSGDPKNEDQYGANTCHAFEGRAVAIVRTKNPGCVALTVGVKGLTSGSASVAAK